MCLLCTVIGKMLSATLCLHHIANLFYSHSQPTVYYNSWSKITSNKTFWIEVKWSENDLVRLIVNIWSANGSSAAEWTLQDSRRWKKQNKQTKTKKHISTTCFFFLFCFFGSNSVHTEAPLTITITDMQIKQLTKYENIIHSHQLQMERSSASVTLMKAGEIQLKNQLLLSSREQCDDISRIELREIT